MDGDSMEYVLMNADENDSDLEDENEEKIEKR